VSDEVQVRFDLPKELSGESQVHTNLNQEVLITTVDKLRLGLEEYRMEVEAKQRWVAPSAMAVTLLIAVLTSEFKEALGFGPEFWRGFFALGGVASLIWLAHSIWLSVQAWKRGGIDRLIRTLSSTQKKPPSGGGG